MVVLVHMNSKLVGVDVKIFYFFKDINNGVVCASQRESYPIMHLDWRPT